MSFIKKAFQGLTGVTAGRAAIEGSEMQAGYMEKALDYLKQQEELPTQFREAGLSQLAGLYGMEGGTGSQQDLIDQAQESPLYAAMQGTRDAGEQSIMRNAAATGGLRSGNVQNAMYDYNQRLDERSLMESYNQQLGGLQGLAGLPSNANNIANLTSGIGQTYGQGITAKGQASQDAWGNIAGLATTALMGI